MNKIISTKPVQRMGIMEERVLIVDEVAANRIIGKARLGAAGYMPLLAANGQSCLSSAKELHPALILLDLALPDMDGVAVIASLRAEQATRHIPIIAIGSSNGRNSCIKALEAGADDALIKPYDDALLLARIRNLLRTRQTLSDWNEHKDDLLLGLSESAQPFISAQTGSAFATQNDARGGTLAIICDRSDVAIKLRHQLSPLLREHIHIVKSNDALNHNDTENSADIYLIDGEGAQYDRAQRLLAELRCRSASRNAGICLMIDAENTRNASMAFDLGANEVVDAQMDIHEIALRIRMTLRRKKRTDSARSRLHDGLRLAAIDPLTGLFNRRYATAQLARMSHNAHETGKSFAIMVADLDHFKAVNDHYGHRAGDMVLSEAARRLTANLRQEDLLARIGGEEFLIALPDTDLDMAHKIAQRLCQKINAEPLAKIGECDINVTISIGLSIWHPGQSAFYKNDPEIASHLIEHADRALMASKAGGRNMVTIGSELC